MNKASSKATVVAETVADVISDAKNSAVAVLDTGVAKAAVEKEVVEAKIPETIDEIKKSNGAKVFIGAIVAVVAVVAAVVASKKEAPAPVVEKKKKGFW